MLSLAHLRSLRGSRLGSFTGGCCKSLHRIRRSSCAPLGVGLAAMATVVDTISLNQDEQELFNLLLEAVKHGGTGTTLRCAGGWVRDKLLGKESKDIDVALDNMLGKEFADKVRVW